MRTAIVVYRSQTGTTCAFAEAIGDHVRARGSAASVVSVGDRVSVDARRSGRRPAGMLDPAGS